MAFSFYSYGQSQVQFSSRANYSVNGDFTIIGNANLTPDTGVNSGDMIYVDIDGDPTTVNSSSATIQLKNESGQVVDNTSNIVYAGLYWTGRPPGQEFIVNNPNNGLTNTLNKSVVSLKGPGSTGYTDITANSGDIYYPEGSFNDMYIAFADVTGFVQSNGTGEYTVADIALVEGQDNTVGLGIGYYGGWSMVIVYENSSMRNRNIGVFDGYSFKGVPNDPTYELLSYIDLDISTLNTADNVNARIGVMGAEGDADLAGDALTTQYGGTGAYIQRLSHSTNTTTNFFNSSINVDGFPRSPNDPVIGIDLSKFDLPEVSVVPDQENLSIQYTATTDKYVIYNLTLAFETVTLPEPPEDATYECIADVPVMQDLIADDVCSDIGGTITSVNTQTTNSSDPCNVIITRTWSFTNSCGDTSSVSQTITIIDTTAPIAPEAPADITVACLTDLPTDLELEATDNCGAIITAVGVDNIVSSSDGGCNQSVIRTWTFEDQCGNSSEISQNITVIDDVAPIFIDAPQDIVYDCDGEQRIPTIDAWVQLNGYGLATDNCSGITWTNNYDSTIPMCNESVTVEFTVTDACGNSISQSATYTVLDETGPVIETEPEALVMECNENSENVLNTWLTSNGGGLATDACSTDVTWSNDFNEDTFNLQSCGEDNATTVTFTATDFCGNITTTTATITVIDVTAPTLPTNVPADIEVECYDDVPATINLTATDECAGEITVSGIDTEDNTDPTNIIITRTWTFTDACGNTSEVSQIITVSDVTAPVIDNVPTDLVVECLSDVPTMEALTATDNCVGIITSNGTETINDADTCNVIITRNWMFTDNSGNSTETTQTITVKDETAPVVDSVPDDITIECNGDLPVMDVLTATDNCVGIITAQGTETVDDSSALVTIVTRTWSFTDNCGNSTEATQTITVEKDVTAPVVDNTPTDLTLECIDDVPAMEALTATDECSGVITSNGTETINDADTCNVIITRNWIFTDDSGNSTETTQTITVKDETAPVVDSVPDDITIECNGDLPVMDVLTATDNCVGIITAQGTETVDHSSALVTIVTRTWSFTDNCGNSTEATQTITVEKDVTAPVVDNTPTDLTLECIDDVPAMEALTATDECSGVITSNGTETINDTDTCNVIITRNWIFTDDSGNSTEVSQTITVADTQAPIVPTIPADITIECSDDLPVMIDLTAQDNCSAAVIATPVDVTDNSDPCNVIITRTWTFEDACGNVSTGSQTINVIDQTAPSLIEEATDIVFNCTGEQRNATIEAWVGLNGYALAADNCSDVTWTNNYDSTIQSCTGPIEVIFTATDACGNSTTTSATYVINDETSPEIDTEPQDIVFECDIDDTTLENWLNNNGGAVASDYCSDTITWSNDFVASSIDASVCGEDNAVTVTFTAVDNCGNATETTATITIIDETAPTAPTNVPADVTVECYDDVPAMINLTATDECAGDITVAGIDTEDNTDSTNIIITRTWTFTDACGNTTEVSQTISVKDETAPVVDSTIPTDMNVECIGDVPAMETLTATDNCVGTITSDGTEVINDTDACNVIITRTWIFTDNSENTTEITQTIIVKDETAPVVTTTPTDINIECDGDIPTMEALIAIDNCAGELTSEGTETINNTDPNNTTIITRTWSFSDTCGNTTEVSQTIYVKDVTAPVVDAMPTDATYACIDDVPELDTLTATDNCSGELTSEGTEIIDNTDSCNVTITRTWMFTDNSDNTTEVTQTITVIDDVAPTAPAAPADVTVQCSDDVPAIIDLTATDNCGEEITATGVDTVTDIDSCSSIITRTWSFTDSCGNTSTASQIITVADTIAPTLVSDLNTEVEISCSELPAVPELEFTDNCSSTLDVQYTEENTSTGAAFENYLVLRDWTVTDTCGNTSVFTQTITVNVQQDVVLVFDNRCTEGGAVDLDNYLVDPSIDGSWIVESGETTINGSSYDPINSEVGATYVFTFTEAEGCQNQTTVSILVNEDCVEPTCDPIVSTTVTPNGDQWNEYFTVTGLDRCGFVINVEIYNRWGALVYKAQDYQNNWNGKNDKGAFGNASNLPTGTYYYIVTLKNSGLKPLTGSIYLGTK
ncbi:gliding motility-associated C-terminal domain-containing protein [uncultured Formosa sp.]|uniref:gliding motility-associated C-terminal domain-containing protein n=1 Tax=uncultured Formosa sp. TaxID=255435 RepID=UPI0026395FBC|nr:gliding motility-associated C-terminal domain-containing protein [uncultured Formosa sp.]